MPLVLVLFLALVGCKSSDKAPDVPVVIEKPPVVEPSPEHVKGVWCKANLVDFSPCNPYPKTWIGKACDKIGEKAPGCAGGAECKEKCE